MMIAAVAHAQSDLWEQVNPESETPQLRSVTPTNAQLRAVAVLLRGDDKGDVWECEGVEREKMIQGLTFEAIPIAESKQVLLVEAGSGCARGGQSANGAMWLVQFEGTKPELLASPKRGFSGWLYSIQPTASHGYRDIVLGWHIRAGDTGLTYFRFKGKSYEAIGSAEDADGDIVPRAR